MKLASMFKKTASPFVLSGAFMLAGVLNMTLHSNATAAAVAGLPDFTDMVDKTYSHHRENET